MRTHSEEIISRYSAKQLYEMVADVEKYPEFIPWCVAARVYKRMEKDFKADVVVSFAGISEKYTSRVHLLENEIKVEYVKGPFSVLENNWKFTANADGTKINFYIKFAFKSRILESLIGSLFEKAVHKMVVAFDGRAKELYG